MRIELAPAADPMWELASSLRLLGRRPGVAAFNWWRRWVRYRLPESARVLEWLYVRGGVVPEFLLPAAGRNDLEAGLAAVLETGSERLRADLHGISVAPGLPCWATALPSGNGTGLPRLAQAIRDYFEAAVAPHWETVRAQVEADREVRAEVLANSGADALLAGLRPMLPWDPPMLVLAPTYFSVLPEIVPASTESVRLAYPALHQTAPIRARRRAAPTKALSALLGPTRAAALTIMAAGCSTSDLAARLGVTPSAVSKHTAVLRAAGLITTRRDRNTVLHSLTSLGNALLDS